MSSIASPLAPSNWLGRHPHARESARWTGWALLAVLAYVGLILIYGKSPLHAFHEIWASTLTSRYGLEDVAVRMTPLLFTAMAVDRVVAF